MASLRDIRKRIKSVKSTQQITKAMKMVAAAKLRRAQEAIIAARPYAQTLDQIISDLAARSEELAHPLLASREEVKRVELVILTSDRGLAGGFNSNVLRRAARFLYENETKYESIQLSTIGRKGADFFRRRGTNIRRDHAGLYSKVTYRNAADIAEELAANYLAGKVDAVYVVYNEFLSAISQKVTLTQLLPFQASTVPAKHAEGAASVAPLVDFKYEPGQEEVLNRLVPQALSIKFYRAILESVASEHGARMSAMENATSNASDMIGKLTLFYNRTRQAAITKELMEIVSGAEALK
ncbi:MAG: ATP synthase F1 subunit gamma [Myxococcaceae bacterium]